MNIISSRMLVTKEEQSVMMIKKNLKFYFGTSLRPYLTH